MIENTTLFENVSLPNNGSQEDALSMYTAMQIFAPTALLVDRIVSPIWYVIGLIGNPISCKIWLGKRMRKNNSSAIYLGILAAVHIAVLLLHIVLELNYAWGIPLYNENIICELFNVSFILPQYLSPLLVLAFTVERYIAVCHPFSKEKFCTNSRAVKVTVCLAVLSVSLASVQAYIWRYDAQHQICGISTSLDIMFEKIWTLSTEMLLFFVVPVLALIFNIMVIREIQRLTSQGPVPSSASGCGSPTSTVTLLSVSFYFICTLLPASIVYALQSILPYGHYPASLEEMAVDPVWQRYFTYLTIRKIVEEICLSNNACYVFIYYITGPYFRREVNNILGITKCKKLMKQKSTASTTSNTKSEYTLVSSNGKTTYDYASTQI